MKKFKENRLLYFLLALSFITIVVWYFVLAQNTGGKMTVAFLDVGQGDSIFVESPSGNKIMIDGGPDGSALREISKILPFYDREIDAILVTNPDTDHYSGFLDILKIV